MYQRGRKRNSSKERQQGEEDLECISTTTKLIDDPNVVKTCSPLQFNNMGILTCVAALFLVSCVISTLILQSPRIAAPGIIDIITSNSSLLVRTSLHQILDETKNSLPPPLQPSRPGMPILHAGNENTASPQHEGVEAGQSNLKTNSGIDAYSEHERSVYLLPQLDPKKSSNNEKEGGDDVQWCRSIKSRHGVRPGVSWGTLNGKLRVEYGRRGCDVVLATGRAFSCDDFWGINYLKSFYNAENEVCSEGRRSNLRLDERNTSSIRCRANPVHGSKACLYSNAIIDFSKAPVSGNVRTFRTGFLEAQCKKRGISLPLPPGIDIIDDTREGGSGCDLTETTPSMFMSHDLIFNLGHTVSDFWIVFITMKLFEESFAEFQLVNMDAIRGNGPAGRGNKLNYAGHPDFTSNFFEQCMGRVLCIDELFCLFHRIT